MRWNRPAPGRCPARTRLLLIELLEDRTVLHGAGVLADIEAGAALYLPEQHRLSTSGRLLTGPRAGEPLQIALDYLREHAGELGLTAPNLAQALVTAHYTDEHSGITHIYFRQTHDGLEVMNADLSINVTARGEIINVSSSFLGNPQVTGGLNAQWIIGAPQAFAELSNDLGLGLLSTPEIVRIDAQSPDLETVLAASGVALEDVPAKLVYVPAAGGLELAWRLNVQTLDKAHWYDSFVAADSGELLYTDDWVGHASYRVFPSPLESPNDGPRTLVTDPHDPIASPLGWHDTNGVAGAEFTDTRGNNATVQEDGDANNSGGSRPDGGASLNFDFPLDIAQNPVNFQSAAMTNLFYWINLLHDIHYQYGFTEAAGNFQVNNYGRGGLGNDPVLGDIQDGDGGGPSFVTPPDGQSPRMQMYIRPSSGRDSALDSHIIIHEYGHGISERLTGGPANNQALNGTQSRGMGEGWGDWWAIMLTQDPTDAKLDAYPIGAYYFNMPGGGRRFPYSFDMAINPLTYADYNNASTRSVPHNIGEIWASALWDMNWLLIEKHGFSSDFYHGTGGNNLALQLVMDALKLQGTNPSLLDGRDAILTADVALTGGQNQAEIWTAFARRGMGFSASDGGSASSTSVVEAFDTPGFISGTIFRDDDADGVRDGPEPGLAGWTVFRDLNNNGIQDGATTTTFNSTDTPKAIPNQSNTTSSIVISGLSGVIVDVNITVNITHPADSELNLALLPPSGTPVILAQFLGGNGANYTNTVFDDEAATHVTSASAPFTGSFKPYFSLSQFDGISPNGTWRLRLDDVAAGNSGTLLSWSMQVTNGNPDPTTVTDANGNYTFFGTGNGTHHIRAIVQPGFTQTAPAGGVQDVVISGGQGVVGRSFGNRAAAAVANVSTLEDTLSSAIAINPPAGLGATHFKISNISGGLLFKNNGVTPINNGDFITVAEGQAGVRFQPSANSNVAGSFDVELSKNGTTVPTDTSKTTGTVTVTPVGDTPQVANSTTLEDTLSGAIIINRNALDGAEVTHFKISGITGGTLFKSDGITPIGNNSFITFAEAQAGVKFLPSANSNAAGRFDAESSQDGTTVTAQSAKATSTITVTPVGDTPQIANSATLEDTLSGAIILNRNAADGVEVTHFKISGITGGTLFKIDGVTVVSNGAFLTFAEAQAGVRFLPATNSTVAGHFDVESSQDGATVAAQSNKATGTITVTPVGDTPQVANSTTLEDTLSGAIVLSRNALDGAEVTHFKISGITGGTLFKSDGVTPISNGTFLTVAEGQAGVHFLPASGNTTSGRFDVESSQDGATVAAQSGKATSTITVNLAVVATSVDLASSSPTATYGQAVTLTATVTPANASAGTPTGSIQFRVDGINVGDLVPLNAGSAQLVVGGLAVGSRSVTAAYTSDTPSFISSNSPALAQEVARAPLTVTAHGSNKVYDATTVATVTLSDNRLGADAITLTFTSASFTDSHAGLGKTINVTGIVLAGPAAGNYVLQNTSATTTANITRAPLTIRADDQVKVEGAPMPMLTAQYTGFLGADSAASLDTPVTLTTTATAASPAGSYPIVASGAADSDYVIAFEAGTLTITPAPLTVQVTRRRGGYTIEVRSGGTVVRTVKLAGSKFSRVTAVLRDVDDDGLIDLVIFGRKNGKRFTRVFFSIA